MYKPIYLRAAAIITADTLALSSNIDSRTPAFTLHFTFAKAKLLLTNNHEVVVALPPLLVLKSGVSVPCDAHLLKLHAQTMTEDRLEVIINSNSDPNLLSPDFVLTVKNSELVISTCCDSLPVLTQLISYYFDGTDLRPLPPTPDVSPESVRGVVPGVRVHVPTVHVGRDEVEMGVPQWVEVGGAGGGRDGAGGGRNGVYAAAWDGNTDSANPGVDLFDVQGFKIKENYFKPPGKTKQLVKETVDLTALQDALQPVTPVFKSSIYSSEGSMLESSGHSSNVDMYSEASDALSSLAASIAVPRTPNGRVTRLFERNDPLVYTPNYFQPVGSVTSTHDLLTPEAFFPRQVVDRMCVRNMKIFFRLYPGNAWPADYCTPDSPSSVPRRVSDVAAVAGGGPSLTRREGPPRGLQYPRDLRNNFVEVYLDNMSLVLDTFLERAEYESRLALLIYQVEVKDKLESSTLNKVVHLSTVNAAITSTIMTSLTPLLRRHLPLFLNTFLSPLTISLSCQKSYPLIFTSCHH